MSSSLLLVLIVVVWLFVLAPLVVNTRQPIRRTSEALGRTRLLHQGGESVATRRRRPSLSERDVRVASDDADAALETVDAELDDPRDRAAGRLDDDAILIDDTVDERRAEPAAVVEGDVVYELEAPAERSADADSLDDGPAIAPSGAAPAEDVDAGAAADADADAAVEVAESTEGADGADVSDEAVVAEESSDDITAAAQRRDARDARRSRTMAASLPEDARTYLSPEDFLVVDDVERDDSGDVTATGSGSPYAEELVDDDLTEDDLAFAERRRGRGGFDPVSDARYSETRFARRRRSVAVLAALIVVGVALGLLVGGWTWWVPLVGAGLLALYLVYLRRTVIAENELRARRIRRMKLARLGVRNSEDEELGVPERLRRPGAVVVELDDEDPDFADLPYSTYEYPEEDIRRAAGQ